MFLWLSLDPRFLITSLPQTLCSNCAVHADKKWLCQLHLWPPPMFWSLDHWPLVALLDELDTTWQTVLSELDTIHTGHDFLGCITFPTQLRAPSGGTAAKLCSFHLLFCSFCFGFDTSTSKQNDLCDKIFNCDTDKLEKCAQLCASSEGSCWKPLCTHQPEWLMQHLIFLLATMTCISSSSLRHFLPQRLLFSCF